MEENVLGNVQGGRPKRAIIGVCAGPGTNIGMTWATVSIEFKAEFKQCMLFQVAAFNGSGNKPRSYNVITMRSLTVECTIYV